MNNMDDTKLLGKIGILIDEKLLPLKKQLDTVETKVGALDEKVGALDEKVGALDEKVGALDEKVGALDEKVESLDRKIEIVNNKIDKAQEETIDTLSELIASGYNNHERRIKRIENHLELPQI